MKIIKIINLILIFIPMSFLLAQTESKDESDLIVWLRSLPGLRFKRMSDHEILNSTKISFDNLKIKSIPPSIKVLRNLVELDLSDCMFNEIPESVFELTTLKKLNLSGNLITKIPA